jgi:hypothetical protein
VRGWKSRAIDRSQRVNACQVWALKQIAAITSQTKVIGHVRYPMLASDDVLDMKRG